MITKRTDLALEARGLWQESAEKTTRLRGVKAAKHKREGYPVTRVDILDPEGERALGKPRGSYLTIDLTSFWRRGADFFPRAVRAVGSELRELLPLRLLRELPLLLRELLRIRRTSLREPLQAR